MAAFVACNGFFVDPKLVSMSVQTPGSTNLVNVGNTVQLQATGTYDDGSTKNFTGKAIWSVTSNPAFVSVNASGLVTALKVSPAGTVATVQAAAQSSNGSVVSGSTNITLGQSASNGLSLTSSLGTTISLAQTPAGSTITFTATLSGTDKTSSTTFTSSNSSIISITSGNSGTLGTTGTVTITGTDTTDNASGTLTITVNP